MATQKIQNIPDIQETNFERPHGNSFVLGITIKNVDITGCGFLFTLKDALNDPDDDALIRVDAPLARTVASGYLEIGVEGADLAAVTIVGTAYYYDVKMVSGDSIKTLLKGTLTPTWTVTERIA